MSVASFLAQMAPYACEAAAATGLDRRLFLTQWGLESAWGTSSISHNNNFAGIENSAGHGCTVCDGIFTCCPTIADFEALYVAILTQGSYAGVLASRGQALSAQFKALGNSPWACSHYGCSGAAGCPGCAAAGSSLQNLYNANQAAIDGAGCGTPTPTPHPTPTPIPGPPVPLGLLESPVGAGLVLLGAAGLFWYARGRRGSGPRRAVAPPRRGGGFSRTRPEPDRHRDFHFRQGWARERTAANPEVARVAAAYSARAGLPAPRDVDASLTASEGKALADAYTAAIDAPDGRAERTAYRAFNAEIRAQHAALTDAGYRLEPWTKPGQPYANSAAMMADVRDHHHLFYFRSAEGAPPHRLMSHAENERFRAVHDVFGHAKGGHQFGPSGETGAFVGHAQMFSRRARPAMATETIAQNAYFNYGPHAHVPVAERPFAEQKATVLDPSLYEPVISRSLGQARTRPLPGSIGRSPSQSRERITFYRGESLLPGAHGLVPRSRGRYFTTSLSSARAYVREYGGADAPMVIRAVDVPVPVALESLDMNLPASMRDEHLLDPRLGMEALLPKRYAEAAVVIEDQRAA